MQNPLRGRADARQPGAASENGTREASFEAHRRGGGESAKGLPPHATLPPETRDARVAPQGPAGALAPPRWGKIGWFVLAILLALLIWAVSALLVGNVGDALVSGSLDAPARQVTAAPELNQGLAAEHHSHRRTT